MIVNREEFLKEVQTVLPGLSSRDIIEQSSCIIFKDHKLMTYNDEVSCSYKSKIDITGAVPATPLVAILQKLKEEQIEIETTENELLIKGKGRQASIRMNAEILLPVDSVERPEGWMDLSERFTEGLKLVQNCAGKDDSQFSLTCIHIHPKWIEACDNEQVARFKLKTGFEKSVLVRRDSIKHIINFDMTKFSETKNWIHFKNPAGLVLSCRRYVEEYPDLSPILEVTGELITLPKGLIEASEKAEIFSSENVEDNTVSIRINEGKLRIEGEGASGKYREVKKIKYTGKNMSFRISPILLRELTQKHHECQLAKERIKIEMDKFQYVSALGVEDKKKETK